MPRGSSLGQRAATRSQRLGRRRLQACDWPWPRADLRGEATTRPSPPPTARSAASRSTTAASARCSRSPPRAGCCGRASPWRARSGASARGARCSAPPRCSSRSCPTYRDCRRRRLRWWRSRRHARRRPDAPATVSGPPWSGSWATAGPRPSLPPPPAAVPWQTFIQCANATSFSCTIAAVNNGALPPRGPWTTAVADGPSAPALLSCARVPWEAEPARHRHLSRRHRPRHHRRHLLHLRHHRPPHHHHHLPRHHHPRHRQSVRRACSSTAAARSTA